MPKIWFWPVGSQRVILFRDEGGTEKIAFNEDCCCPYRSCCCGGTPPPTVDARLTDWGSETCNDDCNDLNGTHELTYDAQWSEWESNDTGTEICVYSKRLDDGFCNADYAWMAVFLDMDQEITPTETCWIDIGFYIVSRSWPPGSPTEGLPWYATTNHAWEGTGQQINSPCRTGLTQSMVDGSVTEAPVCWYVGDLGGHTPKVDVIITP